MKSFKLRSSITMQDLCDQIGPGDGIDPKLFARKTSQNNHLRKTRQLCGQVCRILRLTLGAAEDSRLHTLEVLSVDPYPDASRLLVWVSCYSEDGEDEASAIAALDRAKSWLRSEVAAGIRRRRAPELHFRLEPKGGDR